jgi:hypothetical protein
VTSHEKSGPPCPGTVDEPPGKVKVPEPDRPCGNGPSDHRPTSPGQGERSTPVKPAGPVKPVAKPDAPAPKKASAGKSSAPAPKARTKPSSGTPATKAATKAKGGKTEGGVVLVLPLAWAAAWLADAGRRMRRRPS